MAYNQKKSIIQGTSGHASALKQSQTLPPGKSGDKRPVDPYEGEKKRYFTEGKPSIKKKTTTKNKTIVEKVKHYIKDKKKKVKTNIKDFLNI